MRLVRLDSVPEEGVSHDRLYVLREGAFEVVRGGVVVVRVSDPGAFLGEISAVLGTAPSAAVVATRDSVVYVIETASEAVRTRPELKVLFMTGYAENSASMPLSRLTVAALAWLASLLGQSSALAVLPSSNVEGAAKALRFVRRERPAAVLGDADRQDVVLPRLDVPLRDELDQLVTVLLGDVVVLGRVLVEPDLRVERHDAPGDEVRPGEKAVGAGIRPSRRHSGRPKGHQGKAQERPAGEAGRIQAFSHRFHLVRCRAVSW